MRSKTRLKGPGVFPLAVSHSTHACSRGRELELVQGTGGLQADFCEGNLANAAAYREQHRCRGLAGTLGQRPISASLRVAANGLELPGSKVKGDRYSAASNALSFYHVRLTPGTEGVVSYSRLE
jgi:hypothetical protein